MDQAEQLRNIVKLQNQRNENSARVITITSGKGGVGKSNTAVNLAYHLQSLGKRVIIFDADFGLANVEVMFGAIPKYNLSDLIFKGKKVTEIISEGPNGIGFISGGSGIVALSNLNRDQISFLIHNLSFLDQMADIIIIDTGAGISDSVMDFVIASPEVIMISTPEPSSLTDSYSLLKALYRNPKFQPEQTKVKVIANKVNSEEDAKLVYDKLNAVVSKFLNGNLEYLGMVPLDTEIDRAIRQQKPVSILFPKAASTKAFSQIALNLLNSKQQEVTMRKGITQLISNFINRKN